MSHHYIKFDNVSYCYPDGHRALKNVSFLISHGEKVAVVGANGAGTLPQIRRTVGLVFQNPDDQLFMPTVEDDVAFGPVNMGLPEKEIARRVDMALEAVGALDLKHRPCHLLSGGQKRGVAIATVLSMVPDILVMDEPSSNLDPHSRRLLIDRIKEFSHTCVVTTHDIPLVREVCPRTIVMADGEIIADGDTAEIFSDTEVLLRSRLL